MREEAYHSLDDLPVLACTDSSLKLLVTAFLSDMPAPLFQRCARRYRLQANLHSVQKGGGFRTVANAMVEG